MCYLKLSKRLLVAGLGIVPFQATFAQHQLSASETLAETTTLISEWASTERDIASEREQWEVDKQTLQDLLRIYTVERDELTEQIEDAASQVSAADEERAALNEKRDAFRAVEEELLETVVRAEFALHALHPRLPRPLQTEIQELYSRIPENPNETTVALGARVLHIAGIMSQVQRFNIGVTIHTDVREFENGTPVQIEAVYFGLGAAYYVDGADLHAGYGVVTEEGWEWVDDDSLAPSVRQFIDVYRNLEQPVYVELPVTAQ